MDALCHMKSFRWIVIIGAGVLAGTIPSEGPKACAAVPMVSINPTTDLPNPFWGFDEQHGDGMLGWTFQLLVPFTVTQVGWYDKNAAAGLSREFQVGLWAGWGSDADAGTPQGLGSTSLIGDTNNGLIIPAGTSASLLGTWRVVDLAEPLLLQPGFYELGGLDTSTTTDVIEYVSAGDPGYAPLTPPGSPIVIGAFFYTFPGDRTTFGPTTEFYLWWGLELGPMLFGTNAPPQGAGLSIRRFPLRANTPAGVLLTWSVGTVNKPAPREGHLRR